jgi:hypothetical protein
MLCDRVRLQGIQRGKGEHTNVAATVVATIDVAAIILSASVTPHVLFVVPHVGEDLIAHPTLHLSHLTWDLVRPNVLE